MSVTIPLKTRTASASPKTGLHLNLPSLNLGGRTLSLNSRKELILRAVTAAVALCDPKEALKIAEKAREKPAEVIDPAIDSQYLNPLLDEIAKYQEDNSDAPPVNDQHRVVARVVNVDPILVAVAHGVVEGDKQICMAGREWIAAIDPELMARAATAGAKEKQLDLIRDKLSRLEDLQNDVKTLEDSVDQLSERVAKLEKKSPGVAVSKT